MLDQLRDYTCTFMSGSKFHSRKARFAPMFVPIHCTFLKDECRSKKLISVGCLAEAVTAFMSVLSNLFRLHVNNLHCQMQVELFLDCFTLRTGFANRSNSYTTKYFTVYEGYLSSIAVGNALCPQSLNWGVLYVEYWTSRLRLNFT